MIGPMSIDTGAPWTEWLRSWEDQQGGHMPDREERFDVMIAALRAHCGDSPRVVDLGSGPGSLASRVVRALPEATVVAVDLDPVLLEIGRHALRDEQRITFVDADLSDPRLAEIAGTGFDAAMSTTALHWLSRDHLAGLYRSLAAMLRPGGIFLNGDRHHGEEPGVIAQVVRAVRSARPETFPEGALTWERWWEKALADPLLAEAVTERARRHHDHPHDEVAPTLRDHEEALRAAGFSEVGSLWQRLDDRVLIAIR